MTTQSTLFFETDNLIEGKTVKLTYNGTLAQNGANEIYVHFGFGLLWNNLQEIKLDKVDDHFETEITLTSCEDINFCFRDENNNWDNNDTKNYSAPITKEEVTVVKLENTAIEVPRLKKSYLIAKKIKIAFYKTISFLSKAFTGEWKKKKVENN
ncbi:MAG: hypothetical protein IJ217_00770 [Clostridia bacterium]|nr:hypothetical protein [Clostridia bacterium]